MTTTKTDTVATVVAPLTTAQNAQILAAFAALHAIVWNRGETNLATSFDALDDQGMVNVCNRALRAVVSRKEAARKAELASLKSGIEGVINTYMTSARAAKSAIDALPDAVKAMLPAFPTSVAIPLEALQGVCGSSNIARIASILNDLGLAKIDGRTYAKKGNEVKAIHVPFVAV